MTLCPGASLVCVLPTPCVDVALSYDDDVVLVASTRNERVCCVHDVFGVWPTAEERAAVCRSLATS